MNEQFRFIIGHHTFDYQNQQLISEDAKLHLTRRESALLKLLCQYRNAVVPREIALEKIWGENDYFMGRSMDVYISKLRKMLKNDPDVNIITIHNIGFMLEVKNDGNDG